MVEGSRGARAVRPKPLDLAPDALASPALGPDGALVAPAPGELARKRESS